MLHKKSIVSFVAFDNGKINSTSTNNITKVGKKNILPNKKKKN